MYGYTYALRHELPHYEIIHHRHGILACTSIGFPCHTLSALNGLIDGPDEDKIIAIPLHRYYEYLFKSKCVMIVAVNAKSFDLWQEEVQEEIDKLKVNHIVRWAIGFDTGCAADSMVAQTFPEQWENIRAILNEPPKDIFALARCVRAVNHFVNLMGVERSNLREDFINPERYGEQADDWRPLFAHWDELATMVSEAGILVDTQKPDSAAMKKLAERLTEIHSSALK